MSVVISMPTVDRSPGPNYVFDTLDSMSASGVFDSPLLAAFVLVDSNAEDGWLPSIKSVRVDRPPSGRHRKSNENAARALEVGAQEAELSGAEWVMFAEDDIEPCGRFLESVVSWLDDHAEPPVPVYSFGAAYPQVSESIGEGEWRYPVESFYGTQCFVVRPHDASELGRYISSNPIVRGVNASGAYDLMIGDWAKARGVDAFRASAPSFVQHRGRESVIRPGGRHFSFDSWPGPQWYYLGGAA